jgi:hypothetical protein
LHYRAQLSVIPTFFLVTRQKYGNFLSFSIQAFVRNFKDRQNRTLKKTTMKTSAMILFAVILVGVFSACDKDTKDPTVAIIAPADNDSFASGDQLHLEMTFADNKDLSWYRVHIGDHEGAIQPEFNLDYEDNNVAGREYHFQEHTIVPASLGPTYYLYIEAKDEAGNDMEARLRLNIKPG